MKYIYGLDLSMSCTGVAICDASTFDIVYVGSIKTDAKKPHGHRLGQQRDFILGLMDKYPPQEISIEQGFTRNNKSTQVIFRVHGVFNEAFKEFVQYYYAPTTVKKQVARTGQATKEAVAKHIKRKLPNIEFKNEDESDAIGVLLTHLILEHNYKF